MVIDSSAITAIALSEVEAETFEQLISNDPVRLISAATLLEVSIVIEARLGDAGGQELDKWLFRTGVDIVPVDLVQTEIARRAWRRFGKGRHSAGLNFGDCFSYALAIHRGEPLLFKGSDFSQPDITVAR
jgi:ribonuclease VapC